MRDDSTKYADRGIVVAGINGGNKRSHKHFAERHGFGVRLLVDPGLKVSERYDAVTKLGPFRLIKRTVVGIDREGRVVYYERGIPSTDEILSKM